MLAEKHTQFPLEVLTPPEIQRPSARWAGTMEMTPERWADIPDNPRQRNTEQRAQRAEHLKVPHPTHVKVNMARLPDGRLFKLDGHTRSHLWRTGKVKPPKRVYADVWDCPDLSSAKELYGTFDSRAAVETVTDQMYGSTRELEVAFSSELLKSHRFAGGMRLAYELLFGPSVAKKAGTYEIMRYWKHELALLDECSPTRPRFPTGIVAAALITFRRYGEDAKSFWAAYSMNAGRKEQFEMDAVQALSERVKGISDEGRLVGYGNIMHAVCVTLSAFDRYLSGEPYVITHHKGNGKGPLRVSGIKAMKQNSLQAWLTAAKQTKRG